MTFRLVVGEEVVGDIGHVEDAAVLLSRCTVVHRQFLNPDWRAFSAVIHARRSAADSCSQSGCSRVLAISSGRGAEDADRRVVGVLPLLDHRDEAAERLADADDRRVRDRRQRVDQRPLRERVSDALEHPVGGIRLHLEPDEVTVVGSGAVAATQVVARDEDDPSLGQELGLAEAGAAWRVQVPVAAVVRTAGDRDHDERGGVAAGGGRGDDRHAHVE